MPKGREGEYVTKDEYWSESDKFRKEYWNYQTDQDDSILKNREKVESIQGRLKKLDGKKGPVKFKLPGLDTKKTKMKPTRSKAKKKAVLKKPAKSRSKSWWEH